MLKNLLLVFIINSVICCAIEKISLSEIDYFKIGGGKPVVMVIAGIHGDEISGIEKAKELKEYKVSRGTLIIIPEANKEAVKSGNRTEYYMKDLNRTFFQNSNDKTSKITKEIVKVIEEYKPNIILDYHESYYNYDEIKDPNFYIGNTIIFQQNTMDEYPELIFSFLEEGFIPLQGAEKGSLNKEVSERMNISVITIESSREDKVEVRKEKYETVLKKALKYLKME
ncbi:succinylglutamate desuccinylase/aspartoacylase family protein [Fusobacterium sp.]|uniref:M99 family carboxypeptidase catalytic domain-containing protein n=1 Tax=Fusobacterium sp. TaxID=68766 RepID=UPI0028FF9697|nr:succinylglutamate desuccinylase/aspartoacylase family protein [Fusobacterium sp.]MDU1911150.1 succinylglutamate desuccinylase/aspartoacylase family protein [Fusobacterium sp.]